MIPRYTRPAMGTIWTDEARFNAMLQVELLACDAWVKEGKIPAAAAKKIRAKAKINIERIAAIEAEVKHDVIAFVSAVGETVGSESRYIHLGLTSSDVLDTAFAMQLVQASDLLIQDLKNLLQALKKQAKKYEKTLMMGRTHGVHAEPITFGLKVATWYAEMKRQLARLETARKTIAVGKISGAVGTYAQVPPTLEKYVLSKLGLQAEQPATQVVSRDRHAFFFSVLAGVAGSIEKIAIEIRHLSRTEVGEVSEPFSAKQKGSSAMPHKKNPILTENITGLARLIRSYAHASMENIALWHERDISHSSVERVIAPDATIALDFMIHRLIGVLEGLQVFEERMKENLKLSRGVVFSQEVLLALCKAGLSREEAYRIVQSNALCAVQNGQDFLEIILKDPAVQKHIDPAELKKAFDWNQKIKNVGGIIKRVLA